MMRVDKQAIVMDASIPGIDGWEATRMLKAGHTTAPIPVLAVTALPPGRDTFPVSDLSRARIATSLLDAAGWLM
jgi:CheY-like chemotaxis protein